MSINCNENIRKIAKLTPRELPHLIQNRENIGIYSNVVIHHYLTPDEPVWPPAGAVHAEWGRWGGAVQPSGVPLAHPCSIRPRPLRLAGRMKFNEIFPFCQLKVYFIYQYPVHCPAHLCSIQPHPLRLTGTWRMKFNEIVNISILLLESFNFISISCTLFVLPIHAPFNLILSDSQVGLNSVKMWTFPFYHLKVKFSHFANNQSCNSTFWAFSVFSNFFNKKNYWPSHFPTTGKIAAH